LGSGLGLGILGIPWAAWTVDVSLAMSDSTGTCLLQGVSWCVPQQAALLVKIQHTVPALGVFLLEGGTPIVEYGMAGAGCFGG